MRDTGDGSNTKRVPGAWKRSRVSLALCAQLGLLALLVMACSDAAGSLEDATSSAADLPGTCQLTFRDIQCRECLRFTHEATLGRDAGEGYLEDNGAIADVVRDSTGNLWVGQRHSIKVFDPSGQYLRTVGQPGEGPGEYVFAQPALVDSAGNIHVFDPRAGRVTVLSVTDSVLETWPLPFPSRYFAFFRDGTRLLSQHWELSPERVGLPLHIIARDGEVAASFGAPEEGTLTQEEAERRVAIDPDGNLYGAHIKQYKLAVWTAEGETLSSIEGPELNSPENLESTLWTLESPPAQIIRALNAPSVGTLLVLVRLRRDDWHDRADPRMGPRGLVSLVPRGGLSSFFYSRVDLINIKDCSVTASGTYDGVLVNFLGSNQVLELTSTGIGEPLLRVLDIGGLPALR